MELKNLSSKQLKLVKGSLEKFFYSAGTNIAFYNSFRKNKTKTFEIRCQKAIEYQILHIAQLDTMAKLFPQMIKSDLAEDVIKKEWKSFEEAIPGGRNTIFAFLLFALNEGGQAGLEKIVPQHKFILKNQSLKDKIITRSNFLVESVNKTGIEWLSTQIKNGIENRESITQLVKNLRKEAKNIARTRGAIITETELITAMNEMELEVYKRNEIKKFKWICSGDERTCEACLANEMAGEVSVGKEFPGGVDRPPQHILCRCYLLPVLPTIIEGEVWTGQ